MLGHTIGVHQGGAKDDMKELPEKLKTVNGDEGSAYCEHQQGLRIIGVGKHTVLHVVHLLAECLSQAI